jgi:hypothetical protein
MMMTTVLAVIFVLRLLILLLLILLNPTKVYAGTQDGRRYKDNPLATRYYKEVGGQNHAPAALPPELPGTLCKGGWVGFGRHGKLRSFDSIPDLQVLVTPPIMIIIIVIARRIRSNMKMGRIFL